MSKGMIPDVLMRKLSAKNEEEFKEITRQTQMKLKD